VNRGTMGLNSLPKTVTRQRRGCDLNQDPSAPESSTLTTQLPSHPTEDKHIKKQVAAVMAAKDITAATYRINLASTRYSL